METACKACKQFLLWSPVACHAQVVSRLKLLGQNMSLVFGARTDVWVTNRHIGAGLHNNSPVLNCCVQIAPMTLAQQCSCVLTCPHGADHTSVCERMAQRIDAPRRKPPEEKETKQQQQQQQQRSLRLFLLRCTICLPLICCRTISTKYIQPR